ncbi:MAG TPA: hypothetical protein VFV73_25905 [Streptosporangiaceae bacterium]|nr:hypothetical protein [Streptosporangiaceae bacterium]
MTTMTGPAVTGRSADRQTAGPAVAALVYVVAWVSGLVIGPASLDATAPGTAVVRTYAGQQGAAIAQVVLTQGAAGVALVVVVLALGPATCGRSTAKMATRIEVAALAAAVLSLAQCAQGVRLAGWVAAADLGTRHGPVAVPRPAG